MERHRAWTFAATALAALAATAATAIAAPAPPPAPPPRVTGPAPLARVTGPAPLALVTEPAAGAAPFRALITGARRSIELTMYELTDRSLERALAAAAARGVDVRVLLNGGYYSQPGSKNAAASAYLAARRVHVRDSPTYFALTHQKTLTVDDRASAVMTLNFDGEYATTRDFAVVDRRAADVAAITRTFDDDWAGRRDVPSDGTGDLVWSPGAARAVLALIDDARRSLALENEEMAYRPAVDALCAASRRHVAVRIVMTDESDWRGAFARLRGCGASIRLYHGQRYYIHAKLLIADGATAFVGSQNLSTTSLQDNRELGITVTAPALVARLASAFDADYAGASGA